MVVAIVALPVQDSHVWKISSEKVPHLTLLMLGDNVKNLPRIDQFLEHASKTALQRFYMTVDRRGTLGEKKADVLFFDKHDKLVPAEFRRQLLTHPDIFAAYNSTEQFPEWLPHLTLGYPETPAKPDDREYPGVHSVIFDRIALWTGDYEGREYQLSNEDGPVAAMSDAVARGANFLEHYGVKGMKWGVIRSKLPGAAKAAVKKAYAPSDDAKKAQQYMARAKLGGVRNLDNKEMQLVIQRMALEKQYKDLYGERQWHNAGKKWVGNFFTNVARDAAASWVSNPFAAGRRDDGPFRAQAWANGQDFGQVIDGETVRRRSIGS